MPASDSKDHQPKRNGGFDAEKNDAGKTCSEALRLPQNSVDTMSDRDVEVQERRR
jgi:hypothetical protein